MSDNVYSGQQAAQEVAQRWITTMQSMANQIQGQQQSFQQMSQQWMEQAPHQQQAFQQVVKQSLTAYTNLFRGSSR